MRKKQPMSAARTDNHQALRASEEKYRALLNAMEEGFCIVEVLFDEDGQPQDYRLLETNAAFERQTGIHNGVGRRMRELEPRHEDYWFELYGQVALTGEPLRFTRFAEHLGHRWYDVHAFRLGEPRAHTVGILFNDHSERQRTDEDLRQSEERLRFIIESAKGYAIFTTDAHGLIDSWNIGAEHIFGWSEAEILGQPASVLFTPEDRANGRPQEEFALAQQEGSAPDVRWHQRKDGSRVFISGEVRPLNPEGFVKIGRDLTAQQQAEAALRETGERLKALNETLGQKVQEQTLEVRRLASDVINAAQRERQRISRVLHDDLQQQIFAIRVQMSFLKDGLTRENEAARQEAAEMEARLVELVKITRDLSIDLSPPILPGEGLTQALHWLFIRMREQYGLPIELQASGPFILTNEGLHRLLFNCVRELLFNVVKHANATQAVVQLAWLDHHLRIEVQDNGQGFPLDGHTAEISPLEDLPQSLGLATIRHQLSMVGGHMEINSQPGSGTHVILVVPNRAEAGPSSASDTP